MFSQKQKNMKRPIQIFGFILLSSLISCGQNGDKQYLDNLTVVSQQVESIQKQGSPIPLEYMVTTNISAKDSLLICYNVQQTDNAFFSIYNTKNAELLGCFCPRGRGPEEVVAMMLLRQLDKNEQGDLIAELYAFNNDDLLIWNISQSLVSGTTVYDAVIPVEWQKQYRSICRFNFRLNNDLKLLHVPSTEDESGDLSPMHYSVYSDKERAEVRRIPVFNNPLISTTPHYSTEFISYTEDCLKPDKTKIAFGMTYAPILGIVDLTTGRVEAFSLDEKFRLATLTQGETPIWCFKSLQADDDKIYALYEGDFEPRTGKAREHTESIVYVFDWEGNLLEKLMLDHEAYCIALDCDRAVLYGADPRNEVVYRYQL